MYQARSLAPEPDEERELWQPPEGSREEWFRCHGFPCDKWERTQTKLRRLRHMALVTPAAMTDWRNPPVRTVTIVCITWSHSPGNSYNVYLQMLTRG